jgi:hypothetical protein
MKPDWKDAPSWANWLVKYPIYGWAWFEYEPQQIGSMWYSDGGQYQFVLERDTLKEARP